MKKLKVILSILSTTILLFGCSKGATTQDDNKIISSESKQEEKISKKEAKERDELNQKLELLQPGNFQTEMGKIYQTLKYPDYDDLLRYPEEHKEKNIWCRV